MDPRIKRVLAIIDGDGYRTFSLNEMSRIAHLSPSRLRHKFKSEVGVTPTHYVQKVRMRIAAELLQAENVSIKEVRAAIGLESDSYFTHLCERHYGRTPSCLKNSEPLRSDLEPSVEIDFSRIEQ